MKKSTKKLPLDAKELKNVLWATLLSVEEGTIELRDAMTISSVSKAIIGTVNTQTKINALSGRPITQDLINFAEGIEPKEKA